ncbi:hypothetical protein GCM10009037_07090 [Halarchaeum grantii]|uniref:Uncharacterized protein n=1 Tax=Halarchaeum grantii TaxID=1193105 RepID=A0A830FA47_9EURY|nr:hypothetical protein [Halarchaeum grantii]GGL26031.1 hypothetical protein GCM10009037_07090 [Halarchaeum grantii]
MSDARAELVAASILLAAAVVSATLIGVFLFDSVLIAGALGVVMPTVFAAGVSVSRIRESSPAASGVPEAQTDMTDTHADDGGIAE